MRSKQMFSCFTALVLAVAWLPSAHGATLADSFDDWSFDGVQGDNGWFNGYYNWTQDNDGIYATDDFIEFLNEFGPGGGPVEPEGNNWTGTDWDLLQEDMGPWTYLGPLNGHPNGENSDPFEEHWTIRRWVSDYAGEASLTARLSHTGTCSTGTTVNLYKNGELLESMSTASPVGPVRTVGTTLAVGDVIDYALTPVGYDGDPIDWCDSSDFRLTVTDEPAPPPGSQVFATSYDDWSTTGTQGEKNWFYGYYNRTQDADGVYAKDDFIPFTNEYGDLGGPVEPDGNHWTGAQWDMTQEASGPWTELGNMNTHPNGTNSVPNEEHWTIRRWVANDLTQTTPLQLTWQMLKTNVSCGDGVTGAVYINGELVDQVSINFDDGVGVTRAAYVNANPGDVIDLVLTPRGADGCDGSNNGLTITSDLPEERPLYNPPLPLTDSAAGFSGTQGQDGWFFGYYDQLLDADLGDAQYSTDEFIPFLNDGSNIISDDDAFGGWKESENHWNGGSWDLLDNGVVAHGPWTALDAGGGHPAANAQGDEEVHWVIRRWVSDFEGETNVTGLLNNTSPDGDGTVGRILVDGVEVWSEVTNGDSIDVETSLTLAVGSIVDIVIDPDGAGVFDPDDAINTIGLVNDGSDYTTFSIVLESAPRLFIPWGENRGDYNGNGSLDAGDLDMQAQAIAGLQHPKEYDLNDDNLVDFKDREVWVNDLKNTWIGDADLNGEFSSGDMVQVFARGKYERAGVAAGWEDGDWNGDTVFGSSDMVAAFVAGGYEKGLKEGGPNAAVSAVPEPSALVLALVGLLSLLGRGRGRRED